ncbi:hypothetical protein Ddye_017195 [Dipteronia dyeriana]|uniref:MULE transposase domain-containing protein n=1 Tax=Dipteronia dyeriana TaxID=168575 RepID=A0AAD9U859_9ROSI|nr:hypothetical protein Ddye_017195 [Dipteronia dyeriana]
MVLKTLSSDHKSLFAQIRKYGNILVEMNPGSMAKVHVNPMFERFFLCFHAMQIGFLKGCKPLIGLDGCHLSSEFGGVLLSAIAIDANGGIFPLAYCVYESENIDSWSWFLELLHRALKWNNDRHLCFMSDRQKEVLKAIKNEWPKAGNRYCLRHISTNFNANSKCSSLDINWKLWKAAKEGNEVGFKQVMERIKGVSVEAYQLLMNIPIDIWARHRFDTRIKSDHVTNNISECFNRWIKDDRDKPILTLMGIIRRKVMVRFSEKWVL